MSIRLVLSAGHDPQFAGTTNEVPRVREICDRLRNYCDFEQIPDGLGGTSANTNLVKKIAWANARQTANDIYISVHLNAGGGKGNEVWYYGGSIESQTKGIKFADFMLQETGRPNRGAKPDTSARYGRLGEVRDTKAWAWLVECGFTECIEDMNTPADKYARGIARYLQFLGVPVRNLDAVTPPPVTPPVLPPSPTDPCEVQNAKLADCKILVENMARQLANANDTINSLEKNIQTFIEEDIKSQEKIKELETQLANCCNTVPEEELPPSEVEVLGVWRKFVNFLKRILVDKEQK